MFIHGGRIALLFSRAAALESWYPELFQTKRRKECISNARQSKCGDMYD